MMQWLAQNWQTLVVGLIVFGLIAAVLVGQIRAKRKGGSSCGCGCGCSGCLGSGACHSQQQT